MKIQMDLSSSPEEIQNRKEQRAKTWEDCLRLGLMPVPETIGESSFIIIDTGTLLDDQPQERLSPMYRAIEDAVGDFVLGVVRGVFMDHFRAGTTVEDGNSGISPVEQNLDYIEQAMRQLFEGGSLAANLTFYDEEQIQRQTSFQINWDPESLPIGSGRQMEAFLTRFFRCLLKAIQADCQLGHDAGMYCIKRGVEGIGKMQNLRTSLREGG
jgi:hypothetical protein